MERKRKASQKQSTVVEEEGEPKSLKLVLKVPKQAELKKPRPTSLLEDCVQLETADEVLDQLLQISESHLQMLAETLDESVDIFQRMWKMWQSDVPICSVLVRHLAQLAVAARQLPVCVQEFALSLIEHGKWKCCCRVRCPPPPPQKIVVFTYLEGKLETLLDRTLTGDN